MAEITVEGETSVISIPEVTLELVETATTATITIEGDDVLITENGVTTFASDSATLEVTEPDGGDIAVADAPVVEIVISEPPESVVTVEEQIVSLGAAIRA